jgi:methionine-rich copper-binding protein CopC
VIRSLALAGVGGLVLAGSVLGLATTAQAHDYLVDQNPADGATVTELDTISVTANSRLSDLTGTGAGFGLLVQDADGLYYGDGCVTIDGATLSTDAALGAAGTYTVTWQLVSADSHPVSDTFAFDWAPVSGEAAVGSASAPDCGGTLTQPETTTPDAAASGDTTPFWIIGSVVAVLLAVGLTLLLTRKRA